MKESRISPALAYFDSKGWTAFSFQKRCWQDYLEGRSGILNAPTGSGKTFALWFAVVLQFIEDNKDTWQKPQKNGLQVIWVTPLRALAQDIASAMQESCASLGLPWSIGIRNGDTSASQKEFQKRNPPECLVTTPETLHILLAQKDNAKLFKNLKAIIIDEWHELLGNKRGVQIQLAISHIQSTLSSNLQIWGISATIGNLEDAHRVLLGQEKPVHIVKSDIKKDLQIHTVYPNELEKYPWSGHLGIQLLDKVIPIIEESKSVLLFTNTRAQTEIWYKNIIEVRPDWAGYIAIHHGSLDLKVRSWVEESLHQGKLKLVVCTSSLDLGVDFRPVEAVIQVGSPKGVARFVQRAGRSGHQPGKPSIIYFVPTNSLEFLEVAALREAVNSEKIEDIHAPLLSYDVLIQFLITLAVGEGFYPSEAYKVIKSCFTFSALDQEAFNWILNFITQGGDSLQRYDEFSKVEILEDGLYKVTSKKTAMRHRLSMGTIVSDPMVKVKFKNGAFLGMIEEYFLSRLKPGGRFFFAGRNLEFLKVHDNIALVQLSKKKSNNVPAYMGGRISLTSQLSKKIREILEEASMGIYKTAEAQFIQPLLELQKKLSFIPDSNTFLIEHNLSKEGYHIYFYAFEGRMIHEILGALLAYRISQSIPLTFSIAMNDYGFELLTDEKFDFESFLEEGILFSEDQITDDLIHCINESEMAKRRFRDIATISGLVFQGYPGKPMTTKHLQSNSGILYGVFESYDADNLLLHQAHREVLDMQMEKDKIIHAIRKINKQQIILKSPGQFTPFSFPIMVDRLRAILSSETIEDRIVKMKANLIDY
ncbi:ligase-associated DNA damage response DEXH box helicase [Belliella kenyensis]|uniref:Ligase-associated DNA damage response DEXH box helicase n=1 Tax=Belliella kenyensis TaxID=1472724 RepID=A0ABV8EMU5_9BACT|nr:ligase-associated DNA damage response DEXH box helicase [Belliella kenyensis]MCH7400443.1 ligase-associated DNA damage response DEXH box helicase [Belliella kenyensis]MDN3604541.1 ligase-associated DNA damage response DEXH box helicase [Belliella kenyensis]